MLQSSLHEYHSEDSCVSQFQNWPSWTYGPKEPLELVGTKWELLRHVVVYSVCAMVMSVLVALWTQLCMYLLVLLSGAILTGVASLGGGIVSHLVMIAIVVVSNTIVAPLRELAPECTGDGMAPTKISMALSTPQDVHLLPARAIVSVVYVACGNPAGIFMPLLQMGSMVASAVILALRLLTDSGEDEEDEGSECQEGRKNEDAVQARKWPILKKIRQKSCHWLGFTHIEQSFVDGLVPTLHLCGMISAWTTYLHSPLSAMSAIIHVAEAYVDLRDHAASYNAICFVAVFTSFVASVFPSTFFSVNFPHVPTDEREAREAHDSRLGLLDNVLMNAYIMRTAFAIVSGLLFGVLGHLFSHFSLRLREFLSVQNFVCDSVRFCLCGVLIAIVMDGVYWALDDIYAAYGVGFGPDGGRWMRESSKQWHFYFAYGMGKLFAMCLCVAADAPGGFFMPSLLCGWAVGRCFGLVVAYITPNIVGIEELGGFLGMAALFASLSRSPLAATAITLLFVRDLSLLPVLLLAPFISCLLSNMLQGETLHDLLLQQDGVDPFHIALTIERNVNREILMPSLGQTREEDRRPSVKSTASRGTVIPCWSIPQVIASEQYSWDRSPLNSPKVPTSSTDVECKYLTTGTTQARPLARYRSQRSAPASTTQICAMEQMYDESAPTSSSEPKSDDPSMNSPQRRPLARQGSAPARLITQKMVSGHLVALGDRDIPPVHHLQNGGSAGLMSPVFSCVHGESMRGPSVSTPKGQTISSSDDGSDRDEDEEEDDGERSWEHKIRKGGTIIPVPRRSNKGPDFQLPARAIEHNRLSVCNNQSNHSTRGNQSLGLAQMQRGVERRVSHSGKSIEEEVGDIYHLVLDPAFLASLDSDKIRKDEKKKRHSGRSVERRVVPDERDFCPVSDDDTNKISEKIEVPGESVFTSPPNGDDPTVWDAASAMNTLPIIEEHSFTISSASNSG